MAWNNVQLTEIYDRTSGYCHVCHKKVAYTNYGRIGSKGAWEVDHSVPLAKGGTHRRNNLYAACIGCNRAKGHRSTKTARYAVGTGKAPLSRPKRRLAKVKQAIAGGTIGAALGGVILGPPGALLGAVFCGGMAHKRNPDKC